MMISWEYYSNAKVLNSRISVVEKSSRFLIFCLLLAPNKLFISVLSSTGEMFEDIGQIKESQFYDTNLTKKDTM